MKSKMNPNGKKIKAMLEEVFKERIQSLRPEYREILLADLVTAFENRLAVLNRAQTNTYNGLEMDVIRHVEVKAI